MSIVYSNDRDSALRYPHTVLVLIKLTKFAVALRLHCGCVAVPVELIF